MKRFPFLLLSWCAALWLLAAGGRAQQAPDAFYPGQLWFDTDGRLINAHGGGVLYYDGRYYWYGEHKGEHSNAAWVGVTCYSSTDLYRWTNEGVAFAVSPDTTQAACLGCTLERPKVIYNPKTKQFVMYFHLELRGKGYAAANYGVAVADRPTGPYRFVKNGRVNPGRYPQNMTRQQRKLTTRPDGLKWWTDEWRSAVTDGLYVRRDLEGGQMARDMTLYVDDDGRAYHIYASEENLTLQIAELSDDYTSHTGRYWRVAPTGQNEAPTIFKKDGRYFMITSGCTGWAPNAARLFTAEKITGPWQEHPNPCQGKGANRTFESQGTYILPVAGKPGQFIFMADRWRPSNPIDGRYVWLPIEFGPDGLPQLRWHDRWQLK